MAQSAYSPVTYYLRHKSRTLLLSGLIAFVTLGIYLIVGLLNAFLDYTSVTKSFLTHFSMVSPLGGSLDPNAIAQVRVHPDVARTIPVKSLFLSVPSLAGYESFNVLGVPETEVQYLMDLSNVQLKEGQLLQPRVGEFMLSEEVALALGLRLGDTIGQARNRQSCCTANRLQDLVLVGILTGKPGAANSRLGLASFEFLDNSELYAGQPVGLIVVAQPGRKVAVDAFLESPSWSASMNVQTYGRVQQLVGGLRRMGYLIFGAVDVLVAAIVALVIGVVNQIAMTQRLPEFGLLHAIGHSRRRLSGRVVLETAVTAGTGWAVGLILGRVILALLDANLFRPRGMELNAAGLAPFWFVLPILLVVVGLAAWSIRRVFVRLDPVAIIERDKLNAEGALPGGIGRRHARRSGVTNGAPRSLPKPLAAWVFYLRHPRRGAALIVAMTLMVLGVALPAFFLSPMIDVQREFANHWAALSLVSPTLNQTLDPGVVVAIKTHPAVARTIPVRELGMSITVPPFSDRALSVYGVSEADLQYLMDLYGLKLAEGRLPRPHTNEIVLSQPMATNRGLRVGGQVGRPVNFRDSMPTEMTVVGILAVPDLWLGFASAEFLQSHERYASLPVGYLVAPAEGRKAELDAWLEQNVRSNQVAVTTQDGRLLKASQEGRRMLLLLAAVESIIAIVAAVALAVLNYIFFAQRQDEFGVLHAVGYGRRWLILRLIKETAAVVAAAWLLGALLCILVLIFVQASLYAPKGLTLDLFNRGAWLFTVPIPIVVILVNALAMAWTLARLDPVALVERR